MTQRSSNVLWKTGAFVLIGVVVVTITLLTVRNPLTPGYEIDVWVDTGNGLLMGTPVKVAGVPIGEVMSVGFERSADFPGRPPVQVRIWIPSDVVIYQDDEASVAMLGILGEKYIEILPGPQRAAPLRAGGSLIAKSPVTEAEITQQLTRTLDEFEQALIKVNRIALVPEPWLALKADVEASFSSADELLNQLSQSVAQVEPVLAQLQAAGAQGERLLADLRVWAPWVGAGFALLLLVVAML